MRSKELEDLRQGMQVIAQEAMLEWLVSLLATLLEARPLDEQVRSREAIRKKLSMSGQEYSATTFEHLPASESDLHAAELQEAIDAEMKKIEKVLGLS